MADENVNVPDDVKTITSEEELEKLLDDQGSEDVDYDGEGNVVNKQKSSSSKESDDDDDDDDLANIGKDKKSQPKPGATEGKDDKTNTDDEEAYDNVIHFLDKKHELGLDLSALPKNMTREDEAELVSNLFEDVVRNTENRLRQYEQINQLLQDEEVAMLLQAKSEGKGLKDLFSVYSQSPEGMSDDQLVFNDLKQRYPKFNEDQINKMISAQKKEGGFEDLAKAIREQRLEEERMSATQREQLERQEAMRREQEYKAEVENFTSFVGKINKVNDVNLTDDMKAEVLDFILKRDNNGQTQLDYALQSDVGVLRAAIGVVLLDQLMSANASVNKNKGKNSVYQKLLKRPMETSGSERRSNNDVDDALFNQF